MDIFLNEIQNIDLTELGKKHIRGPIRNGSHSFGYRERAFFGEAGQEHYKLLAYFSTLFTNASIVEIGTFRGYGSLALSYNSSNTVRTFDLAMQERDSSLEEPPSNIEFNIGNILNKSNVKTLLEADLIFLDASHNVSFENKVHTILLENDYRGIMILDDIFLRERKYKNRPRMENWWNSITTDKFDLTYFGHGSLHGDHPCGTGLIDYSGTLNIHR